jgi:hypothetical protein
VLALPPWPWRWRAATMPTTCGAHSMARCLREERNAGEVGRAMGNELPMASAAVGQTVHLAARMEQLAAPGRVFLTANCMAVGGGPGAGQRAGSDAGQRSVGAGGGL